MRFFTDGSRSAAGSGGSHRVWVGPGVIGQTARCDAWRGPAERVAPWELAA